MPIHWLYQGYPGNVNVECIIIVHFLFILWFYHCLGLSLKINMDNTYNSEPNVTVIQRQEIQCGIPLQRGMVGSGQSTASILLPYTLY